MANLFGSTEKERIPKTLEECAQKSNTAMSILEWSDRLEKWGAALMVVLIIAGLIMSFTAANAGEEDLFLVNFLVSVLTWALYAFIELCVFQVAALLLRALANITQATVVTANVALYNASKNGEQPQAAPDAPVQSSSKTPAWAVAAATPAPKAKVWVCPECGNANTSGNTCEMCGRRR